MKINRLYILIAMALCAMSAGAQQLYTQVEVRQPAAIRMAIPVQNILVVNNTVEQPEDFGHQLYRNNILQGKKNINLSEAARNCVFGLTNTLQQQDFGEVSLQPISLNRSANFYSRRKLTTGQIDSLCAYYGVSAVLSLNQLVLYDTQDSYLTDAGDYYAYLETYCSAQWTIHYKGKANPQQFNTTDTLAWEKRSSSEQAAIDALPDRREALLDVAMYEGEQLARKLMPQWATVDRYFYENKDEALAGGIAYMKHQQWSEAIRCWQVAFETAQQAKTKQRNYETMAYAAADMAVAYEMLEMYDESLSWADRSLAAFRKMKSADALQQTVNMQYYISQVKARKSYVF